MYNLAKIVFFPIFVGLEICYKFIRILKKLDVLLYEIMK